MAEYGGKQRNQLSRAIANSETGSRQLKGFVDNRVNLICKNVVQCDRFITMPHLYPHIHVGGNFVTFSHNAHQHSQVEEGDFVYIDRVNLLIEQIINETIVFPNEDNRKRVLNYLRGMRKSYYQAHPDKK